jgi:hypothetical protein
MRFRRMSTVENDWGTETPCPPFAAMTLSAMVTVASGTSTPSPWLPMATVPVRSVPM